MSLADLQQAFAAYLLGQSDAPPVGIQPLQHAQVYRNNVRLSITDALAANFPVTLALVGMDYFSQAARQFLQAHTPDRPDMACYGAAFPAFLASAPGMTDFPYVPEVARFERAMIDALLAPAAPTLTASDFAAIPHESFAGLRFTAHPSVRLIQSGFAVADVWQAHQDNPSPDLAAMVLNAPQWILVSRPGARVEWRVLSADEATFLRALLTGTPIAEAVADLPESFDLTEALVGHLRGGVFSRLHS